MSIIDGELHLKEGIRLFHIEEWQDSISEIEKSLKTDSENTDALYHLALAYANIKEYEKTLDLIDKVSPKITDTMRLMQLHFLSGYLYSMKEMYELAELEFKEILKMGGGNAQVHAALGYIYHKRRDYDKAIFHLEEALKVDPANANAKNSLGYVMVEAGMNIDDAISKIRDALDLDPDNPAYFDSLGWAYFKKGDQTNARRYLIKAFELAPYQEEIKEHLRQVKRFAM